MRRQFRLACLLCALAGTAHAADLTAAAAQEKQQSLLKLRAAIVSSITTPCGVKPKQRAEVKLLLQDNGYLQALILVQSSGAPEFDASLMSAITDTQPFALPKDAGARKELLNLNLKFDAYSMQIPACKSKG
jgi:TonB family protein